MPRCRAVTNLGTGHGDDLKEEMNDSLRLCCITFSVSSLHLQLLLHRHRQR